MDFSASLQDPSPSGLVQSWSCNGSSNVARYCDPAVDSLLDRAILARNDARSIWHEVLRRIEDDAPAAFLYAQTYAFVVNRRFRDVAIRPESSWSAVWRWKVGAAPRLGRRGILVGALVPPPRGSGRRHVRPRRHPSLLSHATRPGRPALAGPGRRDAHAARPAASSSGCTGSTGRCPSSSLTFLKGVGRGDLGTSIGYGLPVTSLIASRLPATLLLGGTVLLLNFTPGTLARCSPGGEARDGARTAGSPLLSLACYATPVVLARPGAGLAVRHPLANSPVRRPLGSAPRPGRRAADQRRRHGRAPDPSRDHAVPGDASRRPCGTSGPPCSRCCAFLI